MTREEGISLVSKFQNIKPKDLSLFLKWLNMDEKTFWKYINHFRDPRIWNKKNEEWILRDSIINHINDEGVDEVRLDKKEDCDFWLKPPRDKKSKENAYVLIGRGWVNHE